MRLNLGCGGVYATGWVNVDRALTDDAVDAYAIDLVANRWPWDRGSAEGIVIHHVLDLLTVTEMRVVLDRCYDTLDHGAVLRMSNANLSRGVQAAIDDDIDWFAEIKGVDDHLVGVVPDLEQTVGWFITQGGARKQNLTVMAVQRACERAGFQEFALSAHGQTVGPGWMTDLDSRENESWYCEAVR